MKAGKSVGHNTQVDNMVPPPPRSTQSPLCLKVFIQRDYSDGTSVKFQTQFPPELEGKLDRGSFEYTISQLNAYFMEAERGSCSTYCEGCMACLTAYLMYICAQTHYEKCLRKVSKFVAEQNERVYKPRGLFLVSPVERGLRVLEIELHGWTISHSPWPNEECPFTNHVQPPRIERDGNPFGHPLHKMVGEDRALWCGGLVKGFPSCIVLGQLYRSLPSTSPLTKASLDVVEEIEISILDQPMVARS